MVDFLNIVDLLNISSTIVISTVIKKHTFIFRIGRTGRFGKTGLAINLVDSPKSMAVMKEIEKHFGKDIHKLDAEDVDEIEKIEK